MAASYVYSLLLALALSISAFAPGANAAPLRAVIELFTSQGCSSCPPADKLLATLAKDPKLIALSLPVDYWDRLGWQDTFAKHAFTERQQAYATTRGDGQVYTPQAVVNGSEHAVGSQVLAIEGAVAETSPNLRVPLSAERKAENILVSIGAADGQAAEGTVLLLPLFASREVAIGRGENARRTVTYTNIVRDIIPAAHGAARVSNLRSRRPTSRISTVLWSCYRRDQLTGQVPFSVRRARTYVRPPRAKVAGARGSRHSTFGPARSYRRLSPAIALGLLRQFDR